MIQGLLFVQVYKQQYPKHALTHVRHVRLLQLAVGHVLQQTTDILVVQLVHAILATMTQAQQIVRVINGF